MAAPAALLFAIYRGASYSLVFTMTTNGSVSGWTARFSARERTIAADPLVLDVAAVIADAGSSSTPGVFTVALSKAQTLALKARPYAVSLERIDSGSEDVLSIGTMTVKFDVRNAA